MEFYIRYKIILGLDGRGKMADGRGEDDDKEAGIHI